MSYEYHHEGRQWDKPGKHEVKPKESKPSPKTPNDLQNKQDYYKKQQSKAPKSELKPKETKPKSAQHPLQSLNKADYSKKQQSRDPKSDLKPKPKGSDTHGGHDHYEGPHNPPAGGARVPAKPKPKSPAGGASRLVGKK